MPAPPATPTLADLRRHAIARSLFTPTTLPRALARLGFVQADPIRAPARAQDLILRPRVRGYRAGDLERRYPRLDIEEDAFVNYGFVVRALHRLMHPRTARQAWSAQTRRQADAVLDFVRARGVVHPDDVDRAFAHGRSTNWFGGTSRSSTQLLDGMHYRGLLRIAHRVGGVRCYAVRDAPPPDPPAEAEAAFDRLLDAALALYAPLPQPSLSQLASRLGYGAPQWRSERASALRRACARAAGATIDGVRWLWPADENPRARRHRAVDDGDALQLLAPFDPVVWDRRRFELFWGWAYRFEAYTPAARRVRGYYALPLLWRGQVCGWGNLAVEGSSLVARIGWQTPPRTGDRAWRRALDAELARHAAFLGLDDGAFGWRLDGAR